MEKMTTTEWTVLWNQALDIAMSEAIPEEILDSYTRQRLTGFLCEKALKSGRRERNGKKRQPRQQKTTNVSITSAKQI